MPKSLPFQLPGPDIPITYFGTLTLSVFTYVYIVSEVNICTGIDITYRLTCGCSWKSAEVFETENVYRDKKFTLEAKGTGGIVIFVCKINILKGNCTHAAFISTDQRTDVLVKCIYIYIYIYMNVIIRQRPPVQHHNIPKIDANEQKIKVNLKDFDTISRYLR